MRAAGATGREPLDGGTGMQGESQGLSEDDRDGVGAQLM